MPGVDGRVESRVRVEGDQGAEPGREVRVGWVVHGHFFVRISPTKVRRMHTKGRIRSLEGRGEPSNDALDKFVTPTLAGFQEALVTTIVRT